MDLSVIIVSYNAYSELKGCLESVYRYFINYSKEIIVVDNNSVDRSVKSLATDFPDIKLVLLEQNVGFGKANNIGVSRSKGKYLLFLNPDTVLIEDFLAPIINFIDSHPGIGACAPMLLNEDMSYQTSTGMKMGIGYEILEAFMLIKFLRKIEKRKYLKFCKSSGHIEVGWTSAACMLISKKAFENSDGFSTDYFLNYEDIDICRRLNENGFKNFYFPAAKCIHLDHRSFRTNFELLVYSRYLSRLTYAAKYYSLPVKVLVRIIHIAGIIIRLATVYIFYSDVEKTQRTKGYFKSLRLYLNLEKEEVTNSVGDDRE